MPIQNIQFAEWAPDRPNLTNGQTATLAQNVIPAGGSYRPFPSTASVSTALGGSCVGAFGYKAPDGTAATFAGTQTKLYKFNDGSWSDVSVGAGSYTGSSGGVWEFAQYGNRVIATNGTDAMQSFVLGSSSAFAALASPAPLGKHIGVIKDFVFIGDCNDTNWGAGYLPNALYWCAIDDPTHWYQPGSANAQTYQSDTQVIPTGGAVMAISGAAGGCDGLIFLEKSIYRVAYEGAPLIFGFYEVERARGTPCSRSVVNAGSAAFYVSDDGFYMTNGASSVPIGVDKVDKWFWGLVNQSYLHNVIGVTDPINKLVGWAFPSTSSANGQADTLIVYNYAAQKWSYASVSMDTIFRDYTPGTTLDAMSGTLDGMAQFPMDSRVWKGGLIALSCIDGNHMLARFAGTAMQATIDTGDFSLPGGQRMFINGVRPLVDGAAATVRIRSRDSLTTADETEGADVSVDADGVGHMRVSTRYARARVTIPAAAAWSHAQGVEVSVVPEGTR